MASNRKYSNGMWKDESKQQEAESSKLFKQWSLLLGDNFSGMGINFNQVTGDCAYTLESTNKVYFVLLNRNGDIIQEALTNKTES